MAKGYLIANLVVDELNSLNRLKKIASSVVSRYGGRILSMLGDPQICQGTLAGRLLLIEFFDVSQARNFYASDGLTDLIESSCKSSCTGLQIVEGLSVFNDVNDLQSKKAISQQDLDKIEDDLDDLYRHHSHQEGIEGG